MSRCSLLLQRILSQSFYHRGIFPVLHHQLHSLHLPLLRHRHRLHIHILPHPHHSLRLTTPFCFLFHSDINFLLINDYFILDDLSLIDLPLPFVFTGIFLGFTEWLKFGSSFYRSVYLCHFISVSIFIYQFDGV